MKVTVTSLTNLQDELTAVSRINNNISALATAIENTLSRDGTSPNTMGASLDMNSQRIINLPEPVSNTEPVRYAEFEAFATAAQDVLDSVAAAEAAQVAAEAAQAAAEASEANAAISETNAGLSETAAAASALAAVGDAAAADASATAAALSETNAAASAVAADASADAAAVSETNADASEAAAVAAAASLATYTASWSGTSATSNTIGTGSKSFTASTGKLWTVGAVLQISSDASPTDYMNGLVTAYDSGTGALTVNVLDTNGSGTLSDWNITIAGTRGPAGVATIADGDKGDIITSGSGATWTFDWTALTSVVYVAKTGSDSDAGTLPHKPKLTIAAAITAAVALGATKAAVVVLDAGQYTENLTLSANIYLYAPNITLIGTLSMDVGTRAVLDRHYAASGGTPALTDFVTSSGEASFYHANICDGRGTGGALTNVDNFRNSTSGRVGFVSCRQMFVTQGGNGFRDDAVSGFGHIHFRAEDIYLAGNNAVGILTNNANTYIIGYVDHLLEIGSPTSTIGIRVANNSAKVVVTAGEIVADEVYNITNGELYLTCPLLTGTRTGTPVVEISNRSIHSFANTGLSIYDSDSSHALTITTSSNLSTARTLTIVPGDASRTLTISGNATISQDYSTTGNPQFATIELGAASDTTLSRASAGVVAVEGNNVLTTATGIAQGKQTIWIPAVAMVSRTTNGAAAGTAEMTTNKNMVRTLDFDTTTQEFAQFEIAMPKSWNEGTVTFQPVWSHPSTTTNFGVVWALQAVATSDDDTLDVAFGTEQTSTDTGGTTNDRYVGPESSAITIGGSPAEGDVVQFQIKRNPSDGSDTMAVDARLHGIKLYITLNASTDA